MPDSRDWVYPVAAGRAGAPAAAPKAFPLVSRAQHQGAQGSCVAHGITQTVEDNLLVEQGADVDLSRAFLYYEGRKVQGWQKQDTGMLVRDAINVVRTLGVPSESSMPYDVSDFRSAPSAPVVREARRNKIAEFRHLPSSAHMLAALERGQTGVAAFTVYESFGEVEETGVWSEPSGVVQGGHAVRWVGYDLTRPRPSVLFQNWWGDDWGTGHPLEGTDSRFAGLTGGFFWVPIAALDTRDWWDIYSLHSSRITT